MSLIDTMILSVDQITQEVTTIQLQQQKHNLYSGGTNINSNKICLIEEPFLYRIHYYTHCSTPLDHSCTVPQSRLTGNSNVGNRSQEQQRSTWGNALAQSTRTTYLAAHVLLLIQCSNCQWIYKIPISEILSLIYPTSFLFIIWNTGSWKIGMLSPTLYNTWNLLGKN